MLVTIMVDASWCPDTKAAGYGAWLASERRRCRFTGQIQSTVSQAMVAEEMAIVNAIAGALKRGVALAGDTILVRTDCQAAIQLLQKYRKPSAKEEDEIVSAFDYFVKKYGLQMRFKHIKGHSSNQNRASVSNTVCDRHAREQMQKARAIIKLQQVKEKTGFTS